MSSKIKENSKINLNNIIKVKDLYKTFHISGGENIEVLKGLTLKVVKGEFVCIMGPSGSGKSTFLNILSSIETITKADIIRICDIEISNSMDEKTYVEMRRKYTSIIYQDFNLLNYLTALENVMFPMMISGISESKASKSALALLERVHLSHRINNLPDDLSGGEQQRVAIARSLANKPQVLLADEPTGNLDTATGDSILQLFRDLVKDGLTIIMVTHDVALSKKADRIMILREGKLYKEEEVMEEF